MPAIARRLCAALLIVTYGIGCAAMQSAEQSVENNPKAVLGSVIGAGGAALLAGALGGRGWTVVAAALAEAAQRAFEAGQSGQPSVWNNPDSGNHGSVTPTHTYQLANGQYCREYTQDIFIGNEKHQTYGTACRQADGTWKIQPS